MNQFRHLKMEEVQFLSFVYQAIKLTETLNSIFRHNLNLCQKFTFGRNGRTELLIGHVSKGNTLTNEVVNDVNIQLIWDDKPTDKEVYFQFKHIVNWDTANWEMLIETFLLRH